MIEKHDTNTFLFQENEEIKEREHGNENYKFYSKYLKIQLKNIMERKNDKTRL